jgi:branched-chain amino acid transport system permease protein
VLSGAVAAVAGAMYAPWSRIVTVEEVHWLASAQPMLNTLLGGVSSFWGPVLGAGLFAAIAYSTRTLIGLSELIVGCGLLAIILLAPNGAVGLWRNLEERLFGRRGSNRATRPDESAKPEGADRVPLQALKREAAR